MVHAQSDLDFVAWAWHGMLIVLGLGHYIRNYEEVIMQEKPGRSEGELELLFWVFER